MAELKVEFSGPGAEAVKEIASGGRGALRRAFGAALTEFGEMLSDQMRLWRFRNLLSIRDKVDRLMDERSVPDALLNALPFGDAMRTLEAASQEDSDEIQELWARLIINSVTGTTQPSINKLHIELLRSLSAADRALLELLYPSIMTITFTSLDQIRAFNETKDSKAEASWRKFSEDERGTSVQNLLRLRCITATPRLFRIDNVLTQWSGRDRRNDGALINPREFEDVMGRLVSLIYQASGAVAYDAASPIPLHSVRTFGRGHEVFGEIRVPELNHMLTPLGTELMKAVTLEANL